MDIQTILKPTEQDLLIELEVNYEINKRKRY